MVPGRTEPGRGGLEPPPDVALSPQDDWASPHARGPQQVNVHVAEAALRPLRPPRGKGHCRDGLRVVWPP